MVCRGRVSKCVYEYNNGTAERKRESGVNGAKRTMEKRDLLGLPDEEPVFVVDAPGVPSDDVSEGSEDEEEAFAPDPPAASDNCANPIEGG